MATSDTGSTFDRWSSGLYGYDGAATASVAGSPTSGDGSPVRARDVAGVQLGRRAGRPSAARKRSRASRRAPVTLLNTDAANFRAMVQQFTGIPAAPSPFSAPTSSAPVISFASDYGFPPPAGVMSFDHSHAHQQQRQPAATFQDHHHLLRPHHHYTGGDPFNYSSNLRVLARDAFGHGLPSPEADMMLLQSMQQAAAQTPPPSSTANNTSSSINGYHFP